MGLRPFGPFIAHARTPVAHHVAVPTGPRTATRQDFEQIVSSLSDFWGDREVAHLHHPTAIEEFGDAALVICDPQGRVAAYLFGMIVGQQRLGYVHVVAVRDDRRGNGYGRRLYDTFCELAAARGCTRIKSITAPGNAGSIAFHESIGMRAREIPDYSGPGRARVIFSADLQPAAGPTSPPIPGVILRAAAAGDINDILEFWRLAAEDTDRPVDRPEAVKALVAHDPAALLLAFHQATIIGCVILGWDGWRAHLYRLAVHPDHRRRGLARWLLTAAEQRLRGQGAIRMDAMVLDGNDAGSAIWSAAGYSRQDNWSRWVKPLRPQP
jgi:ribosomal protein S18 acetylase RimI-like enzyme